MKVFIDGSVGTTGLRIYDRLRDRQELNLISLSEEDRKKSDKRKEALNECDLAFLCLPDEAARQAVSMIENDRTIVIDASTAHRTLKDWAYGFPELSKGHRERIKRSKRIAVPGCHASGFIGLVYPLIKEGIIEKSLALSLTSITGYSGGGRAMIEDYNSEEREVLLDSPRQYGLEQKHKHLPEMKAITGLDREPIFSPIVADFYSGMAVSIPLFAHQIKRGGIDRIKEVYKDTYGSDKTKLVSYNSKLTDNSFIAANLLAGKDSMQLGVGGNSERILLIAVYDNLGKGASGAAIQCLNIVMGLEETRGLII